MSAHLRCENVTVRFGGVVACNNISLDIEEGKIVGLIGPNGAGKTTLFNVFSRFQNVDAGEVFLRDKPIAGLKAHNIIQLGMARTFQNINLFSKQTTLDNILIGAHRQLGNPIADMLHLPTSRRNEIKLRDRAVDLAGWLNLGNELDTLVKNLPYGMQKRVEFARALASEPDIILLDEPVAGCNEEETSELMQIIKRVNRDFGITILLVEHDMSMMMEVCDYIHVINFGANLAQGTPGEIQSNGDVINAYLGEGD